MASVHCTPSLFMSFRRKIKPEMEAKAGQQKNIDAVRSSMQIYANKHANERKKDSGIKWVFEPRF